MFTFLKAVLCGLLFFCLNSFSQDDRLSTVDNSKFVQQSVPATMNAGESYTLIVTFENNGSTTWMPNDYRLNIFESADVRPSMPWGVSNMLITYPVFSGKTVSFEIKVTAPSSDGIYAFQSKMMHGDYKFGESSERVDIVVSNKFHGTEAFNNASFVEQTVQPSMFPGREYKVLVSFTNNGTLPWTAGKYRLVDLSTTTDGSSVINWSKENVELNETIPVGSTKVFNFKVTAPVKPGNYLFQWRMSADGSLFGDASTAVIVNVRY